MGWDGCRMKFQEWDLDLVNYVYIHLDTQSCLLNSQYFLHSQMCKILEGSIISTFFFSLNGCGDEYLFLQKHS